MKQTENIERFKAQIQQLSKENERVSNLLTLAEINNSFLQSELESTRKELKQLRDGKAVRFLLRYWWLRDRLFRKDKPISGGSDNVKQIKWGDNSLKEKQNNPPRKKIALVIDTPDWALDHIADQIIKHLSDDFEFLRIYMKDIDNYANVILLAQSCELIHTLWRRNLVRLYDNQSKNRISKIGLTWEEFKDRYINGKAFSTQVCDHLLLDEPDSFVTQKLFSDKDSICTHYAVSSEKLWDIYQTMPGLKIRPIALCQDGVDLGLFRPISIERLRNINGRTIFFGWAGNSSWKAGDLKGINTIIRPAIEELQKEGYDIQLITADRQEKMIPFEDMPEFYAQLDCYICASITEGTPLPVLESMACGLPVISTDVGIVPEAFGDKQKEYILEDRSIECLKEKIKLLIDRNAFEELSEENLISIRSWDWAIMTENYRRFFRTCLQQ